MSLRFQKFDYVDLSYSVPREKPVLLKCPNKGSRKTVPLQKKNNNNGFEFGLKRRRMHSSKLPLQKRPKLIPFIKCVTTKSGVSGETGLEAANSLPRARI